MYLHVSSWQHVDLSPKLAVTSRAHISKSRCYITCSHLQVSLSHHVHTSPSLAVKSRSLIPKSRFHITCTHLQISLWYHLWKQIAAVTLIRWDNFCKSTDGDINNLRKYRQFNLNQILKWSAITWNNSVLNGSKINDMNYLPLAEIRNRFPPGIFSL